MYAMNSKNQVSDRVIIRAWWGRQAKASLKSGRYHKTEEQKGVSLVNNLGGGGKQPRLREFRSKGLQVGTTEMGWRSRKKASVVGGQ